LALLSRTEKRERRSKIVVSKKKKNSVTDARSRHEEPPRWSLFPFSSTKGRRPFLPARLTRNIQVTMGLNTTKFKIFGAA
jgi:hypothetical protein